MNFPSSILPSVATVYIENEKPEKSSKTSSQNEFGDAAHHHKACFCFSLVNMTQSCGLVNNVCLDILQIWVPSNPRGAEMLPPSFVATESDFYLRRLWGLPKDV